MCIGLAGVVGFNLKGVPYSNGSTVLRAHIGVNDEALQCTTDKITCCTNVNDEIRDGNFFFPDGTQVPTLGGVVNGYYRNRQSQHIRLHRQPSGILTGQFRCNIPDATGTNMDLFINIGKQLAHHVAT